MPNQNSTQDPQNTPAGQNNPEPVIETPPIAPTVSSDTQQPDITSSMPIHTDLPPLPPDFQSVEPEAPIVPPATNDQPKEDSGSAAPSDLPPMIATPKKKFGGGKIIATILGVLLLVGGVGTGIVLTQQQQLFQPKAVVCNPGKHLCTCHAGSGCVADSMTCSTYCGGDDSVVDDGGGGGGGGGDNCTGDGSRPTASSPCCSGTTHTAAGGSETVCGPAPTSVPNCTNDGSRPITGRPCCSGTTHIAAGGSEVVCGPGGGGGGGGGGTETNCTDGIDNDGDGLIDCLDPNCTGNAACILPCSGNGVSCAGARICCNGYTCSSGTCQGNTETTSCGRNADPGAPVCCTDKTCAGGEKVCEPPDRLECKKDGVWCTISTKGGCGPGPTNPPHPTTPPTPGPDAVCQSVKAYSATWTLLTAAQLSALTPGTTINFCVAGTTSSGSFDKAKFTITSRSGEVGNGNVYPETTVKRPGSQDFCQSYTLTAGVRSVDVTAQIHHTTLGWK